MEVEVLVVSYLHAEMEHGEYDVHDKSQVLTICACSGERLEDLQSNIWCCPKCCQLKTLCHQSTIFFYEKAEKSVGNMFLVSCTWLEAKVCI